MVIKLITILVVSTILYILNIILGYKFIEKNAKKVNYNCLKCGVYDCPSKTCIKKKGV